MKKWIGVALIGIMFLSSIAYAGYNLLSGQQNGAAGTGQAELPAQQIIDYRLSPAQFGEAMSRGFTVATYRYDGGCVDCADERAIVEQAALSNEFQGQIILEEIQRPGASELELESVFGKKVLAEIDEDSVLGAFCEVATSPPLGCVARQ